MIINSSGNFGKYWENTFLEFWYLDQLNKNAKDWCINGVIAYGCHLTVSIFDPELVQVFL